MHRSILASLALMVACHASGAAQVETAPDWASMTRQALAEFSTPNGPIVEVVRAVRCESNQVSQGFPCPGEALSEVLEDFAARSNAALVEGIGDEPNCRWSGVESGRPKGLRLRVRVANVPDRNGRILISVGTRCVVVRQDRRGQDRRGGFLHGASYPFELVDGEWMRRGEVMHIIT